MKAIITGAAGFAGYSLTKALLNHGYEVYAILRPGSEHNKRFDLNNNRLHLIELDCSDFDKIADAIDEACDVFFHLAWFGGRDDFNGQNANIDYTLKALESAGRLHCKRFIGTGSQAEYGAVSSTISEEIMPAPLNAYGAAKVAALYLSKRRAEQLGIEWIWGRIFSLYGDYEPSGRMLPDLLTKLSRNDEVSLSSCEQNWDYLHVTDAAEAFIALAERGHAGEIYNIAHGDYKPLKDFVEEARSSLKSTSIINYGNRVSPFITLQPSTEKIKQHTSWEPKIVFEDGIKAFIENNEDYK